MKLKQILENKILVPRRSKEERQKNLAAVHYRQIQEYIKNGSEGDLDLNGTPLKTLPPNLIRVGGNFDLDKSSIISLNNLVEVEGWFSLDKTPITSLGNLKRVGGSLNLKYSKDFKSLGRLEYVGGNLDLEDTQVESLDNLEYVGMSLWLEYTPISKTHTKEQIRQQVEVEDDIIFIWNGGFSF